jgi:hypothetical protein
MHHMNTFVLFAATAVCLAACAVDETGTSADAIRVDGVEYSRAEAAETFSNADLHWIVTDDGIPTAFTTEDKRNLAVGIRADQVDRVGGGDAKILEEYAALWVNADYSGERKPVTASISNLGNFNDRVTSVKTYRRDIVLYQHAGHEGCSLFIQRQKSIEHLTDHDFCGVFTGTWNNQASSVSVVH